MMDGTANGARRAAILTLLPVLVGGLAACNRNADRQPAPPEDNRPIPKMRAAAAGADDIYAGVTAMPQRVAVLGLLNKRNGLVRDITLKPGESIRIGRAVIRLRACERTAQWEMPQETGAFVQLIVLDHGSERWRRAFSGWLFKDRPDRNIIQHPIYDVFVRSCTMRWPGEIAVPDTAAAPATPRAPATTASSALQSPVPVSGDTATPAPPPAPAPAATPAADTAR